MEYLYLKINLHFGSIAFILKGMEKNLLVVLSGVVFKRRYEY